MTGFWTHFLGIHPSLLGLVLHIPPTLGEDGSTLVFDMVAFLV